MAFLRYVCELLSFSSGFGLSEMDVAKARGLATFVYCYAYNYAKVYHFYYFLINVNEVRI